LGPKLKPVGESGHGVWSPGVPGAAFEEPFYSEPTAFQEAVFGDGLVGVVGASGPEAAAVGEEWGEDELVSADEGEGEAFHGEIIAWG